MYMLLIVPTLHSHGGHDIIIQTLFRQDKRQMHMVFTTNIFLYFNFPQLYKLLISNIYQASFQTPGRESLQRSQFKCILATKNNGWTLCIIWCGSDYSSMPYHIIQRNPTPYFLPKVPITNNIMFISTTLLVLVVPGQFPLQDFFILSGTTLPRISCTNSINNMCLIQTECQPSILVSLQISSRATKVLLT